MLCYQDSLKTVTYVTINVVQVHGIKYEPILMGTHIFLDQFFGNIKSMYMSKAPSIASGT